MLCTPGFVKEFAVKNTSLINVHKRRPNVTFTERPAQRMIKISAKKADIVKMYTIFQTINEDKVYFIV